MVSHHSEWQCTLPHNVILITITNKSYGFSLGFHTNYYAGNVIIFFRALFGGSLLGCTNSPPIPICIPEWRETLRV